MRVCFAIFLIFIAHFVASSPIQLISGDGVCRPTSQVQSHFSSSSVPTSCPLVSCVNCGLPKGHSIVNNLLDTKYDSDDIGVTLDSNEKGAFLLASFDSMYSSKFCGSKAIDFCSGVSSCLTLTFNGETLEDSLNDYDQILRRVLHKIKADAGNGVLKALTVIIAGGDCGGNTNNNNSSDEKMRIMLAAIEKIWKEVANSDFSKMQEMIAVQVLVVDGTDEIASAKTALSTVSTNVGVTTETAGLPSLLTDAWKKVSSSSSRPLLTPLQRQSMFLVDVAYTAGVAKIEATVSQWRSRVGTGKAVGKFGDRVQQLQESVLKSFYDSTNGCLVVRERAERANQLTSMIQAAATSLFRQQVSLAQVKATNHFKDALFALHSRDATTSPTAEEEAQSLRQSLFHFRTLVAELEVDSLGLSASTTYDELSESLQTVLKEFPESPGAKLIAARKMEKQAKKPKKKKGSRAVNVALNLVGMLRPPGYGNLQGFVGYSTGLLGLPLDIMLGIQNDGDSPEIMGEDREYPWLRLQPKIHFDVDV